jgi:hypothetical protein
MVIMLQRLQVKNKQHVMAIGMRFKSHKGLKVDKRKKKDEKEEQIRVMNEKQENKKRKKKKKLSFLLPLFIASSPFDSSSSSSFSTFKKKKKTMLVERHSYLSGNKMIMFLSLFFPIITSSDIKLVKKMRRRSHLHS